jgi:acetyl esterase
VPIDPSLAVLVSDPRNTVRPPPAHVPLDKVRRAADGAMTQGILIEMADVTDAEVACGSHIVPVRHYRPTLDPVLPAILFCHGGGFVWGSIATHDGLCRRLAAMTGAAVISVGYRLSPETVFPGAAEDAFAVLTDLMARPDDHGILSDQVALCGDSAGGAICITVAAMAARAQLPLRHLSLFYPAIDPACDSLSQLAQTDGPVLTQAAMRWFWECYLGGAGPKAEILPMQISELATFPPTTVAVAEYDPLHDEGAAFAARLTDAGVDVALKSYPGLVHGFLSLPVASPVIEAALQDTARRLRQSLTKEAT